MKNEHEPEEQSMGASLSRRSLLRGAGLAFAAAGIPSSRMANAASPGAATDPDAHAGKTVGHIMEELSAYMAASPDRALPDEVTEKAKQHVLDTFAAMISGSQLPPGKSAIQFARNYGGDKISSVACSNILCGPIEAALTNGMLAHSDETDDSHAPSGIHPGCSIVPAALAMAEKFGLDGAQFLRSVVLGYDVGTRVTMTLGVKDFQVGGHDSSHAVGGAFGSAAAGACAAKLNAQQMRWVLDYTVQQASGSTVWQRDTEHVEKAFVFAGMPARNGVTSASVVHSGWTGVPDVFSGPYNFIQACSPQADPAKLVEKLGARYEITRTNLKKWTVGSPIQAPLDALENLLKRHPFSPDQVQKIVVRIAPAEGALVNNRKMPDICLQHLVAVMIIDRTASFRSVHDKARMQDPAVLRLRAKVEYIPDESLARLLPARVAIVEVTLSDGTNLTERIDAVRGTAENPMTRDEVAAKARDLIVPVIGADAGNALIEKVFAIESVRDIREIRPLFQLG